MTDAFRLNEAALPVPPHSIEGEENVLGLVIEDNSLVDAANIAGGASLFYNPVHAAIFEKVAQTRREGLLADIVTLKDWANSHEGFKELGGAKYLVRLVANARLHSQVGAYIEHLSEYAARRRVLAAAQTATADLLRGEAPALVIAGRLETAVSTLEGGRAPKSVSMYAAMTDAVTQVKSAQEGGAPPCVPTGIRALDRLITGLFPGELILLGGRPSMGKTAAAINVAVNVALAGRKVAFASLEMAPTDIAMRVLAERLADRSKAVPYRDLRAGRLGATSEEDFIEAANEAAKLSIEFLPRDFQDVGALLSGAKRAKARLDGLDLVVVDYVQLVRSVQTRSRYEAVTEISTALKRLAVTLNVPVLALSQLSRQVEGRDDRRPRMDDLRESGQLEQDADTVIFCYRDEYYIERDKPDPRDFEQMEKWQAIMDAARNRLELIVAKQRNGPIGTAHILCNVAFNRLWEPEA